MANSTPSTASAHVAALGAVDSLDGCHAAMSPPEPDVAARLIYERYMREQKQLQKQFERDLAAATGMRPDHMNSTFLEKHDQAGRDKLGVANDHAGTRRNLTVSRLGQLDADDEADDDDDSESSGSSSDGELPSPASQTSLSNTGTVAKPSKLSVDLSHLGGGVNGAAESSMESVELLLSAVRDIHAHVGGPAHRSRHDWRRFLASNRKPRHNTVVPPKDDTEEGSGTNRVRGSKAEYKRLDELYNKSIHDYYLAETTQSPHGADDIWEEYTFVVRRTFDWKNEYQKTLIDIKSEELVTVLREVLKDVKTVNVRSDKPMLEPNLLFNYLPDLDEYFQKEKALPEETQNKAKVAHLTTLIDYINTDYASVAKVLYPLLEHHEITYDLLWALFVPNTLIYTVCAGSNQPRVVKLDCGQHKHDMRRGKWFQLDCHYVDYDGKNFGEAKAVIEISEFTGTTLIDALPAFPLAYHEDEEEVRGKLICRGRKFGSFKSAHYKFYDGLAFYKKKRSLVRVNVRARVMVDSLTFRKMNPGYSMSPVKRPGAVLFSTLGEEGSEDDEEGEDAATEPLPTISDKTLSKLLPTGFSTGFSTDALTGRPQRIYRMEGDRMQLIQTGTSGDKKAPKTVASLDPNEMSEEQLLICSPTVLGFSLGDKLYLEFSVEHIRDIVFNPTAFDSLVLPERQKTIVRALVESHTDKSGKKRPGIDDIIKGKGQGLVAVLHGRPGVGKTLTAEGISEYLQRPLYMISASELGTDARTLEVQLSRILDVAHGWGAVLLLDEADVYLERRSVHDLMRNSLVSIFLRLLEYFQGILFLTTNRVETFDEAFQSRIHIALRYRDLDKKARRIIWKTFLDMVSREEIILARDDANFPKVSGVYDDKEPREIVSTEELDRLARRDLNGRQIKNVMRTSQALASSMDEKLAMKHLLMVLEVTEEFEHDLKGTGQIDGMMSYA